MANELGSDSNTVWSSGNASLSMPPPTAVPISATRSDSNIEKAEANSETGNPTTTVTKMQEDEYYEEYEEDYEEEEKHIPPSLNMIGDQSLSSTISALSGAGTKKRERSNAKAVECLDLAGNTIQIFRSGMLASQAFNIQQGDISLCCRGLKYSAGGYRFKFHGDAEDKFESLKGGFRKGFPGEGEEGGGGSKLTRSTRKSRSDYGMTPKMQEFIDPKNILKNIKEIRARRFKRGLVKMGSLVVTKWVPLNDQPQNPTLKRLLPQMGDVNTKYMKKGKLKKAQMQANRVSYGSLEDFS